MKQELPRSPYRTIRHRGVEEREETPEQDAAERRYRIALYTGNWIRRLCGERTHGTRKLRDRGDPRCRYPGCRGGREVIRLRNPKSRYAFCGAHMQQLHRYDYLVPADGKYRRQNPRVRKALRLGPPGQKPKRKEVDHVDTDGEDPAPEHPA